jgi:peroxiredoxin Q/BCP
MLKTGNIAPEFILPDENGNEVSLVGLLQDGPVILYFYPSDFTPGCTKEACAIRDIHNEAQGVRLKIVGISPQDGKSHLAFKKEHRLPFTLVCDPDKVAIKMYGANGPLGFGVRRITYLVNQDQKIQDGVEANIKIGRHEAFIQKTIVLRELAGLKTPRSEG